MFFGYAARFVVRQRQSRLTLNDTGFLAITVTSLLNKY